MKREKLQKTKILAVYSACALVVVIFIAILIGEFGSIAERQFFAPVRMGKYSVAMANIGRFDYLAGFALATSCIFTIAMPLSFSTHCLKFAFDIKKDIIPSAIVNGIAFIAYIFSQPHYYIVLEMVQNYFVYFLIFMAYILPLFTLFIKNKEKNNEVYKV